MGKKKMNKLLLVESINNINNGTNLIDLKCDTLINITSNVELNNYDGDNYDLKIVVNDEASLKVNKVNIVNKNFNIDIVILNEAQVDFNLVLLNKGKNKININIKMEGNNSKCKAKVRVLNMNKDSNADVVFTGTILKNTKDNEMLEDLKGLVLDSDTIKISPIMEVFTNEVLANHLVTIGSFNKDELFYLKSKGLSENKAKEMLILSFIYSIIPECLRELINMEVINYE